MIVSQFLPMAKQAITFRNYKVALPLTTASFIHIIRAFITP
jgi:hypothetical protein